jgi:hypothetical protein
MEHPGQKPEGVARLHSGPDQWGNPCGAGDVETPCARSAPGATFRLVTGTLILADPIDAPPPEWQQAFEALISSHKIALQTVAHDRVSGLKQMTRWAGAANGTPTAPVFAPWQCWSSAALHSARHRVVSPRTTWVASYLFDTGSDRPASRRCIDIMLMSPHPDACLADEECGALPRMSTITAMIAAAKAEGRSHLAIIVPARCRNALALRMLAADRGFTQGEFQLEIVAIEDAIGRMIGGGPSWDAIIVLPELRSIVLAILAQTCGISGPWPLLWCDRDLRLVSAETLTDAASRLPLDATLLIHSLALAARRAGLGYEAHRLHESWARLRDRGVVTHDRGSSSPYVTSVSDADFIELACGDQAVHTRPLPDWKALARSSGNHAMRSPVGLSLVASR